MAASAEMPTAYQRLTDMEDAYESSKFCQSKPGFLK